MGDRITAGLAVGVLVVMFLMVVAAIFNMKAGGSLDDLPSDVIKQRVNRP